MNIVITGGSGFVGRHLLALLQQTAEHELISLSRAGTAPAGVIGKAANVITGEGLAEAMQTADAVVHLVGIIRESGQATFENVHLEGTRHVLSAAREAGVSRHIHMSALGASLEAASRYSKTKAQAEYLVQQSGLDWTIFRPSLIFGEGDEFFGKVLKQLVSTAPVIPQIGDGSFMFRPVWVGDVARAFAQALDNAATIGKSYDVVGLHEYSFRQLLQLMCEVLAIDKPIVPVPLGLMRLGIPLMRVLPQPPLSRDQFLMLLAGNTAEITPEFRETFDLLWRDLPTVLRETLTP